MTYRTAALGFGALFAIVGFICMLVALCTNNWVIIQVNRAELDLDAGSTQTLAAFTRNRGVFKECYDDAEALTYVRVNYFKDDLNECLTTDFISTRRINITYSDDYQTRADLMIAEVVFFCFSLLLCVCGFGVFCYAVALNENFVSKKWSLVTKWSGILTFIAAFFAALGMAFFHGAEYMETQIITSTGAEVPYKLYFKQAQPYALQNATSRVYSWSYVLGWLAVFFEVLAALCLFLCGACCGPARKKNHVEYFDTINSSRSYGQRNLAYEYMEGKAPVIYEAQPDQHPQPHIISEGPIYHDHFRGRHFDPYSKGPVHQDSRAQYNFDNGGWSWQ